MSSPKYPIVILGAVVLLAVIAIGYTYGFGNRNMSGAPTTFEECAAAGNPIMESYPRQCRSVEGKTFVEKVPDGNKPSAGACAPAGCSGQVCVDADAAPGTITTCEYRAEYGCYKTAKCERQTNGNCGWTQTAGLVACLNNPPPLK